jgi:MFS family permease
MESVLKPLQTPVAQDRGLLANPQFRRLLVVQFFIGISFASFVLLPKYLVTQFHASAILVGLANGLPMAANILFVPLVGRILARIGRTRTIFTGALLMLATSIFFAFDHQTDVLFFVVRALSGVGNSLAFNGSTTLASDLAPEHRRAQALAWTGLASLSTNAIAPMIDETVVSLWGWNAVFVLAALFAVIAALVAPSLREPMHAEYSAGPRAQYAWLTQQKMLFLGVAIAMGVALNSMLTFVQPWGIENHVQEFRGFFVLYTVGAVVCRVALEKMLRQWGTKPSLLIALFVYSLAAFSPLFVPASHIWMFGFVLGIGHGITYPVGATCLVEGLDARDRASALTTYYGIYCLGATIAMFGFGHLVTQGPHAYAGVFGLAGLTMLAMFALATRIHSESVRRVQKPIASQHEP